MVVPLRRFKTHDGPVLAIQFCKNQPVFYAGGTGGEIKRININNETATDLYTHPSNLSALEICPDNTNLIAGYSDSSIFIVGTREGRERMELQGHHDFISSISLLPARNQVLTTSYDSSIGVWATKSGDNVAWFDDIYSSAITDSTVLPDSLQVAVSAVDTRVKLIDVRTGTISSVLDDSATTIVSMDSGTHSDEFVTVGFSGQLVFWHTDSWTPRRIVSIGEYGDYPLSLHPEGTQVAVGTDDSVNIYELEHGDLIDYIRLSDVGAYSLDYSESGGRLAVGTGDGHVLVFEPPSVP